MITLYRAHPPQGRSIYHHLGLRPWWFEPICSYPTAELAVAHMQAHKTRVRCIPTEPDSPMVPVVQEGCVFAVSTAIGWKYFQYQWDDGTRYVPLMFSDADQAYWDRRQQQFVNGEYPGRKVELAEVTKLEAKLEAKREAELEAKLDADCADHAKTYPLELRRVAAEQPQPDCPQDPWSQESQSSGDEVPAERKLLSLDQVLEIRQAMALLSQLNGIIHVIQEQTQVPVAELRTWLQLHLAHEADQWADADVIQGLNAAILGYWEDYPEAQRSAKHRLRAALQTLWKAHPVELAKVLTDTDREFFLRFSEPDLFTRVDPGDAPPAGRPAETPPETVYTRTETLTREQLLEKLEDPKFIADLLATRACAKPTDPLRFQRMMEQMTDPAFLKNLADPNVQATLEKYKLLTYQRERQCEEAGDAEPGAEPTNPTEGPGFTPDECNAFAAMHPLHKSADLPDEEGDPPAAPVSDEYYLTVYFKTHEFSLGPLTGEKLDRIANWLVQLDRKQEWQRSFGLHFRTKDYRGFYADYVFPGDTT